MGFISDIFYFVIVIGILVLIHELGHFLAARLSGMRADIFCIGMGYRLFGYHKKVGFKFGKLPDDFEYDGNTDYRVALFPIGGYVKIAGMVDESMDTEFTSGPAQPWEFRSKNAFFKIFVLAAGVIMNFVLAIAIFAGIIFFNGEQSYKTTTIGYIPNNSLAKNIGLQAGDKVLSINGDKIYTWNSFIDHFATKDFGASREIIVLRNGSEQKLNLHGKELIRALADKKSIGLVPDHINPVIMDVLGGKAAAKAGMKGGDTIKFVNGEKINSMSEFIDILKSHPSKKLEMIWISNGTIKTDSLLTDDKGTIGVQISESYNGPVEKIEYNIAQAIGYGFNQTIESVELLFKSIGQMFKGNISVKESVGGPIMIAKQASQQAKRGIASFLSFMALLSVSLAVLNILPFPALDGGHIIFVAIEAIIRRELPLKFKMFVQQTGLIILLLFMAFVIYNDIMR